MSRMGDMIKAERLKTGMSPKALAKKCGVSEGFVLEVEAGRRIVTDDVGMRLLKAVGHKADMLVDFEAAVTDNTPMPGTPKAPTRAPSAPKAPVSDTWRDALKDIVKRVPILDAGGKPIGYRNLPVENGRIEGAPSEKVFYFKVPDQAMMGYRLRLNDEILCVPATGPVDDALMVLKIEGRVVARRVKKLEGNRTLLMWYEHEPKTQTLDNAQIDFMGRAVRVEYVP